MRTRRDFLRAALGGSSLIALAPTVPGFLARTARAATPERDGRVLVVIQLDGGNDGINTVVPFADEGYARGRKALRLKAEEILKLLPITRQAVELGAPEAAATGGLMQPQEPALSTRRRFLVAGGAVAASAAA